jgi:hypothetical protein
MLNTPEPHTDCSCPYSPVEIMNTAIRAKATALTSMSCWIASKRRVSADDGESLANRTDITVYQTS